MSHSRRGVFLFSDCLGELNPPFFNSKKITAVLTSRRKYNTRKETKKKNVYALMWSKIGVVVLYLIRCTQHGLVRISRALFVMFTCTYRHKTPRSDWVYNLVSLCSRDVLSLLIGHGENNNNKTKILKKNYRKGHFLC
jgi:hypothetical protein